MARTLSALNPIGVNRDLPAHEVPAENFTDGINVSMRDGIPERILGYEDVFGDPVGPPIWLLPTLTQTIAFWIYGTDDGAGNQLLAVTDGIVHTDLTPLGGISTNNQQNPYTGTNFNGVPVVNVASGGASTNSAFFWDLQITNDFEILPGWETDASCECLRAFKNYLIAMDYTDGASNRIPNLIRWSDTAEPGQLPSTWVPAADNDAGFLSAAATPGPVIDGRALRDQFLVFKQDATYSLDFVGGQFVFGLRTLFVTSGVIARNCLAEFQGKMLVFTDGDIVITDGHSVRSIVDRRMRRFIFSQISPTQFGNSFVAGYVGRREIWFCFPTVNATYPDIAAVWDYEQDKWSIRSLFETPHAAEGVIPEVSAGSNSWDSDPDSWDSDTTTWDESKFNPVSDNLILADPGTGFSAADTGDVNADGTGIQSRFNRDSFDFGTPLQMKTVRAVWPKILGTAGDTIQIRVGSQLDVDDPISWGTFTDFVIGTDLKVDTFATGRYLSFQFQSQQGQPWQLTSFEVEFGTTGARY